jgi:hypothetical protein
MDRNSKIGFAIMSGLMAYGAFVIHSLHKKLDIVDKTQDKMLEALDAEFQKVVDARFQEIIDEHFNE